ncbi:MAG: DNA primase [Endomicrobiia bacterium]|nr:DNA primase [Endomicrobiaceae bacterium]MDD3053580.1 DNA primase [Endomicrobiaceae bacterium]MDD3922456.1 DNA primase [Endomicrobiaceae bacterium]MDD5101362.1 DNA primase [Endomicrobiaceae bacterium]
MSISDQVIEQVRTASDIVSVVRDYVPDLKKAGRNWKCCCPFHSEKTPSFVVSPEKGIFRCFGCNVAGDVFKFVMLVENISWIEAVKKLAQKNGITISDTFTEKISVSEKTKLFEILENASKFYHRYFLESSAASYAREYTKQRGITQDSIKKFMIGYAPKGKILESAQKKGYAYEVLAKAGLVTKTDSGTVFEYMSDRLVFPIFDVQGRVVAFGGRTLADSKAKYLNTPETIVYSKSANLYGLFQALPDIRKDKSIVLVEGYMDVVLSQQYGVSGAVAPLGTAFTQQQAKLVSRYSENTILLFDSDDAGRSATQRALEICAENDIAVKTASLPEGVDPDEYLLSNGKDDFYKLLDKNSKTAIKFMIDREEKKVDIKTSQGKATAVSVLLDFVTKNKNTIIQRDYIKYIAQAFNLDEELIWREFKRKTLFKTDTIKENLFDKFKNDKKQYSLEEQLLKFLLNMQNRQYVLKIQKDFFIVDNCIEIYNMLLQNNGITVAGILSKLDSTKAEWFSKLAMENSSDDQFSEEFFVIVCKDIESNRLKIKRKLLEKEILLMTEGKMVADPIKIKEYNLLTAQIKGSGKK